MTIEETIGRIGPLDALSMVNCKNRFNELAKPVHGFGRMEDLFMLIAGIQQTENICLEKKAMLLLLGDHGVTQEGVSQVGSSYTARTAELLSRKKTAADIMARRAGVDVIPVDMGIITDTPIRTCKAVNGTKNMTREPAMTREETVRAVESGIGLAMECKEKGYHMLIAAEMGIGNTTAASAIASVFLKTPVKEVAGKGAGIDLDSYKKKVSAIEKAIEVNQPDRTDVLDVLAKAGGAELAGLVGVFLGGAAARLPVLIDGFPSSVAALAAGKLTPSVKSYILPSHLSTEPAAGRVLDALCIPPLLNCEWKVGQGTGALAVCPLIDMVCDVYHNLGTFDELGLEAYKPLGCC